jgi:deoxyuridine 5'-triphosphate nucleotidohydrolase
MDICSSEPAVVPPNGGRAVVDTGLVFAFPSDCYLRVAPRSGISARYGVSTLAGVVDSNYRGNVSIVLVNHSAEPFVVRTGDRIAQVIFERIYEPPVLRVVETMEELGRTERGSSGFGSTGV